MKHAFYWLLLAIFSYYGTCGKPNKMKILSSHTTTLQSNYFLVTNASGKGEPVRVAVSYSKKEGSVNRVIKDTLTTPFVIGGHDILVDYDRVEYRMSSYNRYIRTQSEIIRNYEPGGADYFILANLSNSDSIQYCIVGNQKLVFDGHFHQPSGKYKPYAYENISNRGQYDVSRVVLDKHPHPIYKKYPVLYLLYPELAPQEPCFVLLPTILSISAGGEGVSYGDPYAQEMNFSQPPVSVPADQKDRIAFITRLYEQQYRSRQPTLFISFETEVKSEAGLSRQSWFYSANLRNTEDAMYGIIQPGERKVSSAERRIWVLNTYGGNSGIDDF